MRPVFREACPDRSHEPYIIVAGHYGNTQGKKNVDTFLPLKRLCRTFLSLFKSRHIRGVLFSRNAMSVDLTLSDIEDIDFNIPPRARIEGPTTPETDAPALVSRTDSPPAESLSEFAPVVVRIKRKTFWKLANQSKGTMECLKTKLKVVISAIAIINIVGRHKVQVRLRRQKDFGCLADIHWGRQSGRRNTSCHLYLLPLGWFPPEHHPMDEYKEYETTLGHLYKAAWETKKGITLSVS